MAKIRTIGSGNKAETIEFLRVILLACKVLFGAEPIAFVCADEDGEISVVPQPGSEEQVFDVLDSCDWKHMAQLAREYCE